MPESVTIPAGATSTDLTIYPVGAPGSAGSQQVVLTIAPDVAYSVGAPDRATITIADPGPIITRLSQNSDGGAQLSWSSEPGRVYRVVYKNSLSDTGWAELSGDITATASSISWTDNALPVSGQRYYQVRVVN